MRVATSRPNAPESEVDVSWPDWTYALALFDEDDAQIHQATVSVDWERATEWLRLQALRQGLGQCDVFELECRYEPIWNPNIGAPFVDGFRGELTAGPEAHRVEHVFPLRYVAGLADELSRELVRTGKLEDGALFTYRGLAFAPNATPSTGVERDQGAGQRATDDRSLGGERLFSTSPLAPAVPIRAGTFAPRLLQAEVVGAVDPIDVPVLIPAKVLDEAAERAAEAGECETGGILIGHLRQDVSAPEAFVEITAQVPAIGAEADSNRLSFTPEVWSAVRAAIELRGRGELMLAWWHSHPVHAWCKDCSPEKRADCPLRGDFLSSHDRLLHRTVFPRAYSTALVVNELGDGARTFSLFGSRDGRLEPRGYYRIPARVPRPAPVAVA